MLYISCCASTVPIYLMNYLFTYLTPGEFSLILHYPTQASLSPWHFLCSSGVNHSLPSQQDHRALVTPRNYVWLMCPFRDRPSPAQSSGMQERWHAKNTGVGCLALLQEIFLTLVWNPCLLQLLHCRQILYCWVTGETPQSIHRPPQRQALISHLYLYLLCLALSLTQNSLQKIFLINWRIHSLIKVFQRQVEAKFGVDIKGIGEPSCLVLSLRFIFKQAAKQSCTVGQCVFISQ